MFTVPSMGAVRMLSSYFYRYNLTQVGLTVAPVFLISVSITLTYSLMSSGSGFPTKENFVYYVHNIL